MARAEASSSESATVDSVQESSGGGGGGSRRIGAMTNNWLLIPAGWSGQRPTDSTLWGVSERVSEPAIDAADGGNASDAGDAKVLVLDVGGELVGVVGRRRLSGASNAFSQYKPASIAD
jgi:hypothetical protein